MTRLNASVIIVIVWKNSIDVKVCCIIDKLIQVKWLKKKITSKKEYYNGSKDGL